MIYYFVSLDGDYIKEEENVRGWYERAYNANLFTVRRKAEAEAIRRMKLRIAELKALIKEMK